LDIQNGTLYLGDYIIPGKKDVVNLNISNWPALLLTVGLVLTAISGIVGSAVIDFMQLYILC
jgi:hypothetical protein